MLTSLSATQWLIEVSHIRESAFFYTHTKTQGSRSFDFCLFPTDSALQGRTSIRTRSSVSRDLNPLKLS